MKDPAAFDFDGAYGRIYDHIAHTVIPGYEQLFQATLAVLRQQLGSEARVLVTGCGTGMETCAFLASEPGWRVTAVDPSDRMIAATGRAATERGLDDRLDLFHGVTADLPPDLPFDAATVLNVMHFVPDDGGKDALIRSVAGRVRTGGSVALFDLHGQPGTEAFDLLRAAWSDFMTQRGLVGPERAAFLQRIEDGIVWVPEARVLEICRDAGLRLVGRYFGGLLYGGWLLVRDRG